MLQLSEYKYFHFVDWLKYHCELLEILDILVKGYWNSIEKNKQKAVNFIDTISFPAMYIWKWVRK